MAAPAGVVPHRREAVSAVLLICAAGTSSAVHVISGLGAPSAAMRGVMIGMAAACLGCLVPLVTPRRGTSGPCRGASHLMAMSVVMIGIHLLWIVMAGRGSSHQHSAASSLIHQEHGGHASVMLLVITAELACLIAATAARRLAGGVSGPALLGLALPSERLRAERSNGQEVDRHEA